MVSIIRPPNGPAAGEVYQVGIEGEPPLTFTYIVAGMQPKTMHFDEASSLPTIPIPPGSSGCTLTVHAWDKNGRDQETWVIAG